MERAIKTRVQTVRPGSRLSQILCDGRVTKCNSYLSDCGQFQYKTHTIIRGPDGKIISEKVRIGTCKLTGIACLGIAAIIALGLSSSGIQPNQT